MIVTVWVSLGGGGGDNNPQPAIYKKNLSGHRVQFKKNRLDIQVTLKIDLKVIVVKVMYTLTFHRLLWSILKVCLPRKAMTIQKKGIWSFLRHFIFPRSQKPVSYRPFLTWNFPLFSNPQSKMGVLIFTKCLTTIWSWKLTSRSNLMVQSNVPLGLGQPLIEPFHVSFQRITNFIISCYKNQIMPFSQIRNKFEGSFGFLIINYNIFLL